MRAATGVQGNKLATLVTSAIHAPPVTLAKIAGRLRIKYLPAQTTWIALGSLPRIETRASLLSVHEQCPPLKKLHYRQFILEACERGDWISPGPSSATKFEKRGLWCPHRFPTMPPVLPI